VYPGHWRGLGVVSARHMDLRHKCSKLHRMNQTPGEPAWDGVLQYVNQAKSSYVWPHASATDTLPESHNDAEVLAESRRIQARVDALWYMDGPPDDQGRLPKATCAKFKKDKAKLVGELRCTMAHAQSTRTSMRVASSATRKSPPRLASCSSWLCLCA
jgi:hypothetical protein